jgi:hypothetical protein
MATKVWEGWPVGYFIQYTNTTVDFIGEYDFGSNTRSNTNRSKQYKLAERKAEPGHCGCETKAATDEAGRKMEAERF